MVAQNPSDAEPCFPPDIMGVAVSGLDKKRLFCRVVVVSPDDMCDEVEELHVHKVSDWRRFKVGF